MSSPRVLIYLLRRDLRLTDNPILHELSKTFQQSQNPYTHLLPVYVFPAQQIELSGFLSSDNERSPYPEARSRVGGFWRCGHHRSKFLAESVWDLKKSLESVGSGLEIRVGMLGQVVADLLDAFKKESIEVAGVWITEEEGSEEKKEERDVKKAAQGAHTDFQVWVDEKYYVDESVKSALRPDRADFLYSRDIPFKNPKDLPDIYTTYRKQVEPLRDAPRRTLPAPTKLPPLPSQILPQPSPFSIPSDLDGLVNALHKPLTPTLSLDNPPSMPSKAESAHPFIGGETSGHERIRHLVESGNMTTYKDTVCSYSTSFCVFSVSASCPPNLNNARARRSNIFFTASRFTDEFFLANPPLAQRHAGCRLQHQTLCLARPRMRYSTTNPLLPSRIRRR